MCDPVTMMAIGAASSAMQIKAGNDALAAQANSIAQQAEAADVQARYDHRANVKAALDKGYVAEIAKQDAVGKARVKGASLGIRGTTAKELVGAELQIGDFNTAGSKEAIRGADASYMVGSSITAANAQTQVDDTMAQMTGLPEALVGIAAGGLQGYMTGSAYEAKTSGIPNVKPGG